jgi:trans-2-enoyl-CoA reductase
VPAAAVLRISPLRPVLRIGRGCSRGQMSHYALLGVEPSADAAQVRAAYRKQAVKFSPDREPERFARLQAAYELLSDASRRAAYDADLEAASADGAESFAERFRGGAFAQSGDAAAAAGGELTGDAFGGKGLMGQLEPSVAQAIVPVSNNKGTLMETSYKLTHTEGFDAYLRNQGKSAGQVLTGDEMVKRGLIPATGSVDTVLPPLDTEALTHRSFGEPQQVLRVARVALPDRCAHGQVLVRMLASPLNDEDFVRARAPLEALNMLQPFCRKQAETGVDNGWEPTPPGGGGPDASAPFCGGADGVGVVMAASKHGDNVRGSDVLPNDWGSQPKDAQAMPGRKDFFAPLDWVVALPSARGAPIGCWRRLLVCHEDRLLRVAPGLMPLPSLALHRVFCTAWRLLEDFGALCSGDTVIFNAADEPVGCVVLQLCGLLQLKPICVVADTPSFGAAAARLKTVYGATHVLRDNGTLQAAVGETGLPQPRLALDAMGGAAGDRLLSTIRGEHCMAVLR